MRAAERAREDAFLTTDEWRELAEGAVVILKRMRDYAPWWGKLAISWTIEELNEWLAEHPREKGVPEKYQLP